MKTGLVFSGGGARGAYEAGVWKALEELNIKCDIVTGVSIGSINAIMYVQGALKLTEEFWKKINFQTVFDTETVPSTNRELIKKYLSSAKKGGMPPSNLEKALRKYLDIDAIYNSPIDYGLITVKYHKHHPRKLEPITLSKKQIPKDKLIDYIIASCTVYPVFKLKEIEENTYIDGGFKSPIPVDLAKKLGAEKLIIVNISVMGRKLKFKEDENTIIITPKNNLGFPLKFDGKIAEKGIKYGYNDTMKKFKNYLGKKYTFKNVDKYFESNIQFKSINNYISTMEYLGKVFFIDDTKIYTYQEFNKLLIRNISKIELKKNIKFKDLLSSQERIIYTYNNLKTGHVRRINRKRLFPKEYKAAYYLYMNM